ncbi:MAG: PqqD family protein [Myxococcales bacterium]|nr:PqqD family protein [Myxococcales bacterium]
MTTMGMTLHRAPDAVWRRVEDQVTIISMEVNRVRLLNGVGGYLWERCDGSTRESLVDALCARYAVSREVAERDVAHFVDDLVQRGLLVRREVAP